MRPWGRGFGIFAPLKVRQRSAARHSGELGAALLCATTPLDSAAIAPVRVTADQRYGSGTQYSARKSASSARLEIVT